MKQQHDTQGNARVRKPCRKDGTGSDKASRQGFVLLKEACEQIRMKPESYRARLRRQRKGEDVELPFPTWMLPGDRRYFVRQADVDAYLAGAALVDAPASHSKGFQDLMKRALKSK